MWNFKLIVLYHMIPFSIRFLLTLFIYKNTSIVFQVLAGSYFTVAGALVGILKPGRMSMFGSLLIIWGLVKEGILGKPVNTDPAKAVYVYPTMVIAMICAFSSVKYDVKKVVRSAPIKSSARPLKNSSKSKLK